MDLVHRIKAITARPGAFLIRVADEYENLNKFAKQIPLRTICAVDAPADSSNFNNIKVEDLALTPEERFLITKGYITIQILRVSKGEGPGAVDVYNPIWTEQGRKRYKTLKSFAPMLTYARA